MTTRPAAAAMQGIFFCGLVSIVASYTTELNIRTCTADGCTPAKKRIALDVASNHTTSAGEQLIAVGGNNSDALTLTYGGSQVGGPRVYLIEEAGVNKNFMFKLKNQEFTFDVELSSMPCGFNAALYFVGMSENEGGAERGTDYCDAQAVAGVYCSEMDIMEANTVAQQYTTHACVDACGSFSPNASECKGTGQSSTVCDQSGCGLNPFRYGAGTTYDAELDNPDWYGPSSHSQLDSSSTFTVVTQFHADSAMDLTNITRFYIQNDLRVDLPTLYVKVPADGSHYGAFERPSITADYCTDIYDRWDGAAQYAPLGQMGRNMENGMVLAMSAWYAPESYVDGRPEGGQQSGMSWLDGVNGWGGKATKAGPCDTDTSDQAGPYHATFSDIRIGDIGTTLGRVFPPAPIPTPPPTPPAPPTPPPGTCAARYGQCGGKTWKGPTCCDAPYKCTGGGYYSQCT